MELNQIILRDTILHLVYGKRCVFCVELVLDIDKLAYYNNFKQVSNGFVFGIKKTMRYNYSQK